MHLTTRPFPSLILCLVGLLVSAWIPALDAATSTAPVLRKPHLDSWFGHTPTIDGRLDSSEWSDATEIRGVSNWIPEFSPVRRKSDLSLRGWVKHDDKSLYFAFEVTDDILYGIDTPRWLAPENPETHALSPQGFPWFGDEMELLINGPNQWSGDENCAGDGQSWQMVCNLTKSRLGGIGRGGLLEGEPRSDSRAWTTYGEWIAKGFQRAAVGIRPGRKGYIIEWAIDFNPCLEIAPNNFCNTKLGLKTVGLNIAVGDLDRPEDGKGNFGLFHHEQWWAGAPHTRTQKNNFGTLTLHGPNRKHSP